ncbi:replicative DNA helicase [Pasteurella testudinis DSM 23072]|uniref:Replicative DNA helicase n=2 Tax=Pasteurella testudinis TaxID=761 RepID=A0A1W1UMG3_9PAST|nr:replicative DNA helicase [Pasteurella testudinis DSM 23072]SUB51497.1 replicative DNA helicase [Pasteurella testudinis]
MKSMVSAELYSLEVEQSLIGGLLIDTEHFDEVITLIQANDFYLSAHRNIFDAINTLLSSGKSLDIITLEQHLKTQQMLEQTGGFAYLAELAKNTASAANTLAYAEIIAQYSKQRQILGLGQLITHEIQAFKTAEDLDNLLSQIEKKLTDITLKQASQDVADLPQAFTKIVERMESSALHKDPVSGTPTGIQVLDETTTGGQPGDLILLAARPSMGKTAFSQNIAYHTLMKYPDKPIQYYSLEMPSDQLLQRFMAMRARVSLQDIRQADRLSDEQWSRISSSMEYILDHWKNRLLIDDEGALTPQKLRTKARKNARLYGQPAAIFIDYVQLMNSNSSRYENRNVEISAISQSLKKLAKEMQCPVYALSQLNRSLEQRPNKRPINSDLRESGSLEQDADVILFIYRDEIYNPESEHKGMAEIIIGKQRNGPLGKVLTRFAGEYSLFENIDRHHFDG